MYEGSLQQADGWRPVTWGGRGGGRDSCSLSGSLEGSELFTDHSVHSTHCRLLPGTAVSPAPGAAGSVSLSLPPPSPWGAAARAPYPHTRAPMSPGPLESHLSVLLLPICRGHGGVHSRSGDRGCGVRGGKAASALSLTRDSGAHECPRVPRDCQDSRREHPSLSAGAARLGREGGDSFLGLRP